MFNSLFFKGVSFLLLKEESEGLEKRVLFFGWKYWISCHLKRLRWWDSDFLSLPSEFFDLGLTLTLN